MEADRVDTRGPGTEAQGVMLLPLAACRSASLEGGSGAGGGLINECYWVVESLCPHSPLCHRHTLNGFISSEPLSCQWARVEGGGELSSGSGDGASAAPSV